MKRKVILGLFIIVFLTAFIFYKNSSKISNTESINVEKISQNPKQINEQTDSYEIEIKYPEFSPSNSQTQNLNKAVIELIDIPLKNFKEGLSRFSSPLDLKDSKSQLSTTYEIPRLDDKMISIQFTISEYMAGQAHPLATFMVFNYSLTQHKNLTISDLFKKDSNYLQVLSDLTSKNLHDHFAENDNDFDEFIKSGTEPKEENFQKFIIKKDSLQILFDPYQVAPYVAGPQTVEIPFSEISDLSNQDLLN